MTYQQKQTIQILRGQGQPISQIANKIGLPISTIKSFWQREQKKKDLCKNCRKPLNHLPKRKPKVKDERKWERSYNKRFIQAAIEKNWHLTVVDCHI